MDTPESLLHWLRTNDSVNAYVVIEEPGVRTHRALERLTIGHSWDPNAVHGITIHSLTLKVLR